LRSPPLILAVDDIPENLEILRVRLEANGYEVVTASDGEEGLVAARSITPDLILLDIMMPKRDGISVVRELKADVALRTIPVVLITAKSDTRDVVEGLDAGGDDYLTKPFEHQALLARVRSMLRQKALHDQVQDLAQRLAAWNAALRRFLPAQVADLIVASSDANDPLASHRREVTVVFCDLRGFTAFAEIAEPEEVMTVLAEYHACLGALVDQHEGTLERFMGDGMLVVFNDPLPCDDHTERAVRMAIAMRDAIGGLSEKWQRQGHTLGFGIGIARGHATIGKIGFDRRSDYAVIGSVPNLAARLCDEAKAGQILVSQGAFNPIEQLIEARPLGELNLKGFRRPMRAFEICRWLS
jgi:adenylate cyclase